MDHIQHTDGLLKQLKVLANDLKGAVGDMSLTPEQLKEVREWFPAIIASNLYLKSTWTYNITGEGKYRTTATIMLYPTTEAKEATNIAHSRRCVVLVNRTLNTGIWTHRYSVRVWVEKADDAHKVIGDDDDRQGTVLADERQTDVPSEEAGFKSRVQAMLIRVSHKGLQLTKAETAKGKP